MKNTPTRASTSQQATDSDAYASSHHQHPAVRSHLELENRDTITSSEERALPAAHLRCPVRASRRMGHGPHGSRRRKRLLTMRVVSKASAAVLNLPDGQISELPVQPRLQKYFAFPVGQIISTSSPRPVPQRGDTRSSRTRGGMRWTRMRCRRAALEADGKAVWS
jgi:hypothetical protein